MAKIGCRQCESPDCRGCNNYILEVALKQGKFDALMNGKKTIHVAANVRENVTGEWIVTHPEGPIPTTVFECSVCGKKIARYGVETDLGYIGCPYCLAEMTGGNDG